LPSAKVFVVIVLLAKSVRWFCRCPMSLLSLCYWPRVWDDFAVGECLCCHCAIGQGLCVIALLAKSMRWFCRRPRSLLSLCYWPRVWDDFAVVQCLCCQCAIGQEYEMILQLANVFVVSVLLAKIMWWFCSWPRYFLSFCYWLRVWDDMQFGKSLLSLVSSQVDKCAVWYCPSLCYHILAKYISSACCWLI